MVYYKLNQTKIVDMSCYKLTFKGSTEEIRIPSSTNKLNLQDFLIDLKNAVQEEKLESIVNINQKSITLQQIEQLLNKSIETNTQKENTIELFDKDEILNIIANKLQSLGVEIQLVETEDLEALELPKNTEAVVKDGIVYVNKDLATMSSPMHELLHLVFAAMRNDNFKMYQTIMYQFSNITDFNELFNQVKASDSYKNITELDQLEEAFVRYISGILDGKLESSEEFEIAYNNIQLPLNNYVSKVFGIPQITDLISFLKSPISEALGQKNELLIKKDRKTSGYSDYKYKVDISGKIQAFIEKKIKEGLIEEGDCE